MCVYGGLEGGGGGGVIMVKERNDYNYEVMRVFLRRKIVFLKVK